ncbi:Glu/Leu/Phe/Val dehydrogenase family protein [Leekyejoonella antrihumi]|uniref:Glu/Leu/Phe/Val dehydrogenase family protein n=1 Tax=Leekyejoonella antrihumi TaxID=1660198 RepID=UPI001646EEA9|nr:Glu/Leu/Phe/Val dehydrogenase family protein [Leekyejoonella antrihumi]
MGSTQEDLKIIASEASPVCAQGDPSPYTALGVLESIRACVEHLDGTADLAGRTVLVQGAGNVGAQLSGLLAAESAHVLIADIKSARAERVADQLGATVVPAPEAHRTRCDVLAPCALGAVVTERSLPELACRIIAGGANNVLDNPDRAADLAAQGIVYAPDFLANAGGLIYLEEQLRGHNASHAERRVRGIADALIRVLKRSRTDNVTTVQAATAIAEDRLSGSSTNPTH